MKIKVGIVGYGNLGKAVEKIFFALLDFELSKKEDKTHVSILIRDVMLLEYVILN
mgnify:CR=1 FL=1